MMKRLIRSLCSLLGVCILMSALPYYVQAQLHPDHNGRVLQQLLEQEFAQKGNRFKRLDSELDQAFVPKWVKDSASKVELLIQKPEIRYTTLSNKQILREIELPISYSGSQMTSLKLSQQDSLSKKQFRQVRRQSPAPLKGQHPSVWVRKGIPAAVVVGSIVGIVSLFYIRSQ